MLAPHARVAGVAVQLFPHSTYLQALFPPPHL
jgi:hypothetical protein